jgi:hypothetical protein
MRFILLFFLLTFSQASAQSYEQRELLTDYLKSIGIQRLKNVAHPDSPIKGNDIWFEDNSAFIAIHFGGYMSDFSDTYRIDLDHMGRFTKLEVVNDGSIFFTAFSGCDMARETFSDALIDHYENTSSEQKSTLSYVELVVGKVSSQFSCKDICFYSLYNAWKENGYYSRY